MYPRGLIQIQWWWWKPA